MGKSLVSCFLTHAVDWRWKQTVARTVGWNGSNARGWAMAEMKLNVTDGDRIGNESVPIQ